MEQKLSGAWSFPEQHPAAVRFDRFLRSPLYPAALAVLAGISCLLGLDLLLYTLLLCLGICISLLCTDFLPLVPICILLYVSPSRENNPGRYPNSVFYPANGGIYLLVLLAAVICCILIRLTFDRQWKGFLKTKRNLLPSLVFLGCTYLISGVGMEGYGNVMLQNLVFALIQCFALIALYFFFTGAIHWDRVPRGYLAWTALSVGFLVLLQLAENYASGRIFADGTIDRELIATGWGMHNNIGCMLAMMMPFAFYLAAESKRSWVFHLLGTALLLGAVLSCSRGSMLMAALAYCVCAWLLLRNRESRRRNLRIYLLVLGLVAVAVLLLLPKLLTVFRLFLSQLGNISQRDNLLYYGICQFLEEPIFGGSFFPQGSYVPWDWANLEAFSSFFPPRWHNTLVQLLASCGTFGITAYLIHRVQTVRLFCKNPSIENCFIAVSLGVLLCASLLDCHFFNVGPVLFYSTALAFAEKLPRE